ncbi:hypothetical protein B7463_g1628, partial [Scytalidium lignicola]
MASPSTSGSEIQPPIELLTSKPDGSPNVPENVAPIVRNNEASKLKLRKCILVLASFICMFTSCGLNFAFGVYQEFYESMSVSPTHNPFTNASPAQISLVGTLGVSFMSLGAPFASAWCKTYSPRTITLVGALVFALANILASFGKELWHFTVTQGILVGIGTCLTYIPAVTVCPGWFTTHRGLAMGILSSGTGIGGIAWAPFLRYLNENIGFRNALRLTGAVSFPLLACSALCLKWEPGIEQKNRAAMSSQPIRFRLLPPLIDWRVARSYKFVAQSISAALQGAAYYAPLYFMSANARTLGYSPATGANLIALCNGTSAISKVVLGWLADRVGRLNILFSVTFLSAVVTLGMWLPSTIPGSHKEGQGLFIAFVVMYGITAGTYISLFPTALVELFGVQHFASVNGFLYLARGIAALVGTPVAGELVRAYGGTSATLHDSKAYFSTSIFVGVLLAGASVSLAWLRTNVAVEALTASRTENRKKIWKA